MTQPENTSSSTPPLTLSRDEVGELRRVASHLLEAPPLPRNRSCNDHALDEQSAKDRRQGSTGGTQPVGALDASPDVAEHEHDRSQRKVNLARERNRGQRDGGPDEAPALERQERRRQEECDQAQEVPRGLADPVWSEREGDAADEGGRTPDLERPQPPADDIHPPRRRRAAR